MIAIRFGRSERIRYRGILPAATAKLRRRWVVRAQVWGRDLYGEPARFHVTLQTPHAMRAADLSKTINDLLTEAAADMREQFGADRIENVVAGWLAVSESPKKGAQRSR